MDPQNSGPNCSLCCDIESFIATEFLVFVASLYRSLFFSVATYSLSFLLDYVATDFDNVVTRFWYNRFVLVVTGMSCVATHKCVATSFSFPSASEICRDIIFLVVTNFFFQPINSVAT